MLQNIAIIKEGGFNAKNFYGFEKIKDKTVLITGRYGDIGYSAARIFKNLGARVLIAGRDKSEGDKIVRDLSVSFLKRDVTNEENWIQAINCIDKLDILVDNAGIIEKNQIPEDIMLNE